MFDKLKFSLESAFREMSEAQQKIDASARKIVEGIQRTVDFLPDEAPSSREALTGHDFTWYEATTQGLSAEGFCTPQGFEPSAWLSRPVESRILTEYAMGDGGTVVANWFVMAAAATRAENRIIAFASMSEDGHSFDTVQNGSPSNLPDLPTAHNNHVDATLSLVEVLNSHRALISRHGTPMCRFADMATYRAARHEESERRADFRRDQGLGLVERYLRARFQGDKTEIGEAYLESIRAHPEWYAYSDRGREAPKPQPEASSAPSAANAGALPLTFMMSATEDGRRTVTTFGMLFAGLPELLMGDVAANHSRAARFLLRTVARAISRRRSELGSDDTFLADLVSAAGTRLMLTARDAVIDYPAAPRAASPAPVEVHVSLRGFTADDEPSLLGIDPLPGTPGTLDERLRAACQQLGSDVPVARTAESMDADMLEAHARAVALLPEIKRRFQSGLGAGEKICVKMRAVSGDVGEYVWLHVLDWRDRELSGEVMTPAPRVQLAAGQNLTIDEGRVFDHIIVGAHGIVQPSLTDRVAGDYGHDI